MVKSKISMKILYGIQLNGNGHITRSIEVINRLKDEGHKVDVITSGGKSSLKINSIKSYKGIDLYYKKDGSINWLKTLFKSNIIRLIKDIKVIDGYDLIISDFEPISAWSAKISKIKSIGISNQCGIDNKKIKGFFLSKIFTNNFAPCDNYIPLTYNGEFQPIIRNSVLSKKINIEDFYVVYLPTMQTNKIIDKLSSSMVNWRLYTNDVDCKNHNENIKIIKINERNFINDIVNCKGVITQSGFSTTSECLVLGKKMWSIPIKGQYEQIYNSLTLKEMGIFTKKFNEENINEWLNSKKYIIYDWVNPINRIIEKINNFK